MGASSASRAVRASTLYFGFPFSGGLPKVPASYFLSKEAVPQRHVSRRIKFTPKPDRPRRETRTKHTKDEGRRREEEKEGR
jgi:hypothetical protein